MPNRDCPLPETGRTLSPVDPPPFAAPWEARAFALVLQMHERGAFSWPEWARALSDEIAAHPEAAYYAQWLAAAESLLVDKGLATREQLEARRFGLAIALRARTAAHAAPGSRARP